MSTVKFPWVRFIGVTGGIMAFGYILMKVVTPTPEQLYDRLAPDLQRQVDARRAQIRAAEMARQQMLLAQERLSSEAPDGSHSTNADADKPIWADTAHHPSSQQRR